MRSSCSDSCTSLPIWVPFISFVCLIVIARTSKTMTRTSKTSKTMLNKSGVVFYLCLVPDFSGKAFSFSLLSIILAVSFVVNGFYYVKTGSFYTHFVESVYHE